MFNPVLPRGDTVTPNLPGGLEFRIAKLEEGHTSMGVKMERIMEIISAWPTQTKHIDEKFKELQETLQEVRDATIRRDGREEGESRQETKEESKDRVSRENRNTIVAVAAVMISFLMLVLALVVFYFDAKTKTGMIKIPSISNASLASPVLSLLHTPREYAGPRSPF